MPSADLLRDLVRTRYTDDDHPALSWQTQLWQDTAPLAGVRLLDVTPVFANTVAKYLPLLAAGADLTVSLSPLLPHDPAVVDLLARAGIGVTDTPGDYDVVMDCAGVQAASSAVGYVELTKSGEHIYAGCPQPVLLVDDSRIKLIETSLGTGDGLIRALAHFGCPDLTGKPVVVFGAGKVGSGAALQARRCGAALTVFDIHPQRPGVLDVADEDAVRSAIAGAWCVVSATGREGALAALCEPLMSSAAILANLGAEDEFGAEMPAERVLNGKLPVNFALPEPTRLRYLDATFALVNACALAVTTGAFAAGLNHPPEDLENAILAACPAVADELALVDQDPSRSAARMPS